jgi:hypothetical protein
MHGHDGGQGFTFRGHLISRKAAKVFPAVDADRLRKHCVPSRESSEPMFRLNNRADRGNSRQPSRGKSPRLNRGMPLLVGFLARFRFCTPEICRLDGGARGAAALRPGTPPLPLPRRRSPRFPMQDLASIISLVVLVVVGLGLGAGLMLALDGAFRGDTDRIFEAGIFTVAIIALVCAVLAN